ncbi:MAG: hypothetical protein JWO59_3182 [Chloroflexi bacterium]|nr:hypothetical protein [Chloroflexota bacterium]
MVTLTLLRENIGRPWRLAPLLVQRIRSDSLLRNSVYMMSATVINSLFGYLFWIVAAHLYPTGDIGLAAALLSALTLTSALSIMGLGTSLIQALPGSAPGRAWSLALNTRVVCSLLTGLVAGVVLVGALPLISPHFSMVKDDPAYAVSLVLGVTIWSFTSVLDDVFIAERAAGKMLARDATFGLFKNVLLVAFTIPAPLKAVGILDSSVAASAASAVTGVMLVARLGRHYRPVLRGTIRQMPAAFSSSLGYHCISLGGVAPMYLLPLIITARLSAADTAYFYTTWMIGGIFFIISPAVATSLFAEGSHTAADLRLKVISSCSFITLLLVPAMLLLFFAGQYVIDVFGTNYASHSVALLTILIISAVPDAVTNVYVSVLRVKRKLKEAALLNIAMAMIALILAWLLLPSLGVVGAGWAWLGAQTIGAAVVGIQVIAARQWHTRLVQTKRSRAENEGGQSIEEDNLSTTPRMTS